MLGDLRQAGADLRQPSGEALNWPMAWRLSGASLPDTSCHLPLSTRFQQALTRSAQAPASTTTCASSGLCFATSLSAEAEMRFNVSSGSWKAKTRRGTAPASTTLCASSLLCLASKRAPKAPASRHDVAQRPGGGLLHGRVELLSTSLI